MFLHAFALIQCSGNYEEVLILSLVVIESVLAVDIVSFLSFQGSLCYPQLQERTYVTVYEAEESQV